MRSVVLGRKTFEIDSQRLYEAQIHEQMAETYRLTSGANLPPRLLISWMMVDGADIGSVGTERAR